MRDERDVSPDPTHLSNEVDIIDRMKHSFLTDRSEQTAAETLEKLLSLQVQNIDLDTWLEVKELLSCLLETITVTNLISRHQIIVLNVINNSPGIVVDFLADLIDRNVEELEDKLKTSHIAVAIAFARRICEAQCSDSIAKFLWRFAQIDAVKNELKVLLTNGDSEARFRVHQVTSNYLKGRGDGSEVSELVRGLILEISSSDILIQLTAIEMLCETVYNNKAATAYLFSLGLIDDIYKLLNVVSEHPDAGFLFPAVMKFFGHLSITDSHCLSQYPNFMRSLLDLIYQYDRLDASLRLLAFDTLAVVASTEDAKRYLASTPDYNMKEVFNMFGVAIATGPLELRVRHMEALSLLFRSEHKSSHHDVSDLLEKWWQYLGEGFPTVVVTYLTRPFEQLRHATLQLITNMLSYNWAVDIFKSMDGFVNAILNRRIETTSQGKHMKYDIVRLLVEKGSHCFSSETLMRLKLYIREGPLYVEPSPKIDMMDK